MRNLSAFAAAIFIAGCMTTPTGQKQIDPQRVATLARGAAELGTIYWLNQHPADREYFEESRVILMGLQNQANYDPAAFALALQRLPIKQLQGSEGQLYIGAAILLYDEAVHQMSKIDQESLVKVTMGAVIEGLTRGLAAMQGHQ